MNFLVLNFIARKLKLVREKGKSTYLRETKDRVSAVVAGILIERVGLVQISSKGVDSQAAEATRLYLCLQVSALGPKVE